MARFVKANSGKVWTRSNRVNGSKTEEMMRYGTPEDSTHLVYWENNDGSQSGSYFVAIRDLSPEDDLLSLARQVLEDNCIVAVEALGKSALSAA